MSRKNDTKILHAGDSPKHGGDIDESLVLQFIQDWYEETDDEQNADSEDESNCEWY